MSSIAQGSIAQWWPRTLTFQAEWQDFCLFESHLLLLVAHEAGSSQATRQQFRPPPSWWSEIHTSYQDHRALGQGSGNPLFPAASLSMSLLLLLVGCFGGNKSKDNLGSSSHHHSHYPGTWTRLCSLGWCRGHLRYANECVMQMSASYK